MKLAAFSGPHLEWSSGVNVVQDLAPSYVGISYYQNLI